MLDIERRGHVQHADDTANRANDFVEREHAAVGIAPPAGQHSTGVDTHAASHPPTSRAPAVPGCIVIERDGLRRLFLTQDRRAEKSFGRVHVVPRHEHEVQRLASPIVSRSGWTNVP
jgi:hypothetical protein